MSRIHLETLIEAPAHICFDLARNIGFHVAASCRSGEKAIEGVTSGPIGLGETVTWEARHFMTRQRMTSKIVEFDRPNVFADEMQRGAFHHWRHTHRFLVEGNATRMIDEVDCASPLGFIGSAVDFLILNRYMKSFLLEHNAFLKAFAELQVSLLHKVNS